MNSRNIYPLIKHLDGEPEGGALTVTIVAEDGGETAAELPCRRVAGDLGLFYVYENGSQSVMVQSRMLPDGITEEDLFAVAAENLFRDHEFCLAEADWGGLSFICGSSREACALCEPELLDFAAAEADSDLLIAAPTRDVLLMVPMDDEVKLAGLKIAAAAAVAEDGALSRMIFHYSREHHALTDTEMTF